MSNDELTDSYKDISNLNVLRNVKCDCFSVWLKDNISQVTQSLSRVAQAVTGLDMDYAESLQVREFFNSHLIC